MRIDVPRAIVMYLLWLGLISGALIIAMADALPIKLGHIRPENAFTLLIEAELFFVVIIWPFFVPRLLKPVTIDLAKTTESHLLVLQVLVLFVVALPVALLTTSLADVGAGEFLRGHLLVVVTASFVAAMHELADRRKVAFMPWYLLGAFTVAGLAPFADALRGGEPGLLSALSPFVAAARIEGAWTFGIAAVLGTLTLATMVLSAVGRRPASATA
jgi:hypothetical protein